MNASTARTTEWAEGYQGKSRVHVLTECPHCHLKEAHAVEFEGEQPKCWTCLKTVELSEPLLITVFRERAEHNAQCVRCEYSGRTGGTKCPIGDKLDQRVWEHEGQRQTPFLVIRTRTFGGHVDVRHTACWDERTARAQASVQGGQVVDQSHLFALA
jgi:hypothetical protein